MSITLVDLISDDEECQNDSEEVIELISDDKCPNDFVEVIDLTSGEECLKSIKKAIQGFQKCKVENVNRDDSVCMNEVKTSIFKKDVGAGSNNAKSRLEKVCTLGNANHNIGINIDGTKNVNNLNNTGIPSNNLEDDIQKVQNEVAQTVMRNINVAHEQTENSLLNAGAHSNCPNKDIHESQNIITENRNLTEIIESDELKTKKLTETDRINIDATENVNNPNNTGILSNNLEDDIQKVQNEVAKTAMRNINVAHEQTENSLLNAGACSNSPRKDIHESQNITTENRNLTDTIESDELKTKKLAETDGLRFYSDDNTPLFKVLFRDEVIWRKYSQKIEHLIKYVLASEKYETDQAISNLILDIHDPSLQNDNCFETNNQDESARNLNNKRKREEDNAPQSSLKRVKPLLREEDKHQSENEYDKNDDNILEIQKCPSIENNRSSLTMMSHRQLDYSQINFGNSFIRVGSYGYFEQNDISLSRNGLSFSIPSGNDKQSKIINIDLDDIMKVFADFFDKSALFLMISTKKTREIRKLISSIDSNELYPHSNSEECDQKCITILPKNLNSETIKDIKMLFKDGKLVEIDKKAIFHEIQSNSIEKKRCILGGAKTNNPPRISKTTEVSSQSHLENATISKTTLSYKIIRFDSYEYADERVFSVSMAGIEISLPHLTKGLMVPLMIGIDDILKISVCFSSQLSVLLIYLTSKAAENIRKKLGMNNPNGSFLDSNSGVDTNNKLTIFPELLSNNSEVFKKLFNIGKLERISQNIARKVVSKRLLNSKRLNMKSVGILCYILHIGSYKLRQAKLKWNFDVKITTQYLLFNIPAIGNDEAPISIVIGIHEIEKIIYCLKTHFVFFIHTSVSCAQRIRSLIGMSDVYNDVLYFNPVSHRIVHQRLIIRFDAPKAPILKFLSHFLSSIKSEEVSPTVAKTMIKGH